MVSMNVMAINDQHGRDLNDKKAADRTARNWNYAYNTTWATRKAAGYTAKVGEWYGKKTGDVRGTAAAKTGIDTVSNTLIDAVKGKGVKTTKVVKEAVKNLTQNATSDAMGKVIDPDGIGGQAFKQIVDDGRGELVSRVFE